MHVTFNYEGTAFRFEHVAGDHIARWQEAAQNFYEVQLLEELRKRLQDRDGIVIDVGAHVGNHTVYFASVMGRTTIAVEPNHRVLPHLVTNIVSAGVGDRVTVLGCGAGAPPPRWCSTPEEARTEGNTGMQRASYSEKGKLCIQLDAVIPPSAQVALVKIDVEGFEMDVLNGVLAALLRCRPLIAMEAVDAAAFAKQRKLLECAGYVPSKRHWGKTPVYIWSHKKS